VSSSPIEAGDSITAGPEADGTAGFGYRQELERSLASFASFAAGFSYLSILTGMFQVFHVGYRAGGPAFFWTWPAVFAGQLLVALCFAELAAHYPLAGSVYQWSKYTGSMAVGWMTGWVYLASYVVSLAAVVLALQTTLPQIAPWSAVLANPTHNAVLLGCLLSGFTTVVNAVGVRLMARINNVGVFTELAGASLLVVLLALFARRGPAVVLDTLDRGSQPGGYLGALLAAALMASFVMYGFDTAGSLAEETLLPRRKVPRAILQALVASAVLGALLLVAALMAAVDLHDAELGKAEGGLPLIVRSNLGEVVGHLFLWNVIFAITVCALAVHTGAVRLIFAMARDNNLPASRSLSHVWGMSRTPVVAVVAVGVGAILILVVNVNAPKLMDAIVAVAIVWANLAYLLVTGPLLLRRLRGWPGRGRGGFRLGRWGLPVNALAVLWGVSLVVNMAWPRPEVYGEAWYERWAAVIFTAILVVGGAVYYGLVQRQRTGVRAEHRAGQTGPASAGPR
jgi:urea carboxylase system permease